MAGQEAVILALQREHDRRVTASKAMLNHWAERIGNDMKRDARWTDRTGNARNSLEAITDFTDDTLRLIAKGGGPPDYVRFLELAHAGKYAIVWPTLMANSGRIYQDLVKIWGGS